MCLSSTTPGTDSINLHIRKGKERDWDLIYEENAGRQLCETNSLREHTAQVLLALPQERRKEIRTIY